MKPLIFVIVFLGLIAIIITQAEDIHRLKYLDLRNGAEIDRCMNTLRAK
jgi:hypothetical protein